MPEIPNIVPRQGAQTASPGPESYVSPMPTVSANYQRNYDTAKLVQQQGQIVAGGGAQLDHDIKGIISRDDQADLGAADAYRTTRFAAATEAAMGTKDVAKKQKIWDEAISDVDSYAGDKNGRGFQNFRHESGRKAWGQQWQQQRVQVKGQQQVELKKLNLLETGKRLDTRDLVAVNGAVNDPAAANAKTIVRDTARQRVESGLFSHEDAAAYIIEMDSAIDKRLKTGELLTLGDAVRGYAEGPVDEATIGNVKRMVKEYQQSIDETSLSPQEKMQLKNAADGLPNDLIQMSAANQRAAVLAEQDAMKKTNNAMTAQLIKTYASEDRDRPAGEQGILDALSNPATNLTAEARDKMFDYIRARDEQRMNPEKASPVPLADQYQLYQDILAYDPKNDTDGQKIVDLLQKSSTVNGELGDVMAKKLKAYADPTTDKISGLPQATKNWLKMTETDLANLLVIEPPEWKSKIFRDNIQKESNFAKQFELDSSRRIAVHSMIMDDLYNMSLKGASLQDMQQALEKNDFVKTAREAKSLRALYDKQTRKRPQQPQQGVSFQMKREGNKLVGQPQEK